MENKRKLTIVIITIVLIIAALLTTYFLVNNKDTKKVNNSSNGSKQVEKKEVTEFTDYENIYGKYINSDYPDIYFELKENNKVDIIESTCSDGLFPKRTVEYTLKNVGEDIILNITLGEDQEEEYKAYRHGDGSYYFKSLTFGCVSDENTIFSKNIKNN